MKKVIFSLIVIGFFSGMILVNCNYRAKKEEEARKDLEQTQEDLNKATQLTQEEWQKFRDEMNDKIASNETQFADLKMKVKKTKNCLIHCILKTLIILKNEIKISKCDSLTRKSILTTGQD